MLIPLIRDTTMRETTHDSGNDRENSADEQQGKDVPSGAPRFDLEAIEDSDDTSGHRFIDGRLRGGRTWQDDWEVASSNDCENNGEGP